MVQERLMLVMTWHNGLEDVADKILDEWKCLANMVAVGKVRKRWLQETFLRKK